MEQVPSEGTESKCCGWTRRASERLFGCNMEVCPVCANSEEMFLLLLYNSRAKPSATQRCRFNEEDPGRRNWNFAHQESPLDFVLLPQH